MNINSSKINYKLIVPSQLNTSIPLCVWKIIYNEPEIEIHNYGTLSHAAKLNESDIIKIGKIILKVNKIVIPGINNSENEIRNANPEEEKKNSLIIFQTSPQNLDGKGVELSSPSPKKDGEKKSKEYAEYV